MTEIITDTVLPILNSFAVTAQNASGISFSVSVAPGEASYALSVVAVPTGETAVDGPGIVAGEKDDTSNAPLWVDGFTFTIDQVGTAVSFARADEIRGDVDWYAVVADPAGNLSNVLSQTLYFVDTERPTFVGAATNVAGNQIAVSHSETLSGTEDAANWATNAGPVSDVTFAGAVAVLDLPDNSIDDADTVAVSYAGGDVTDTLGNSLANYAAQPVQNNVPPPSSAITITLVGGSAQDWNGGTLAVQTYTYTDADFVGGIIEGREVFFAVGEDKIATSATVNSNAATSVYQSTGGNGGRTSGFKYTLQASDVATGSLSIAVTIDGADNDGVLALFEYGDKSIIDQDGGTYIDDEALALAGTPTNAINKFLVVAIGNNSQFGTDQPDFGTATLVSKSTAIGSDGGTGFAYAVLESATVSDPVADVTVTVTGDIASTARTGVVLVVIQ